MSFFKSVTAGLFVFTLLLVCLISLVSNTAADSEPNNKISEAEITTTFSNVFGNINETDMDQADWYKVDLSWGGVTGASLR